MQILPVSASNKPDSSDVDTQETVYNSLKDASQAPQTAQSAASIPTFTYDDTYNQAEQARPSHIFSDYYANNNDTNYLTANSSIYSMQKDTDYTLQNDTDDIIPTSSKLHDICINNKYYSELSEEDAAYVLENVNVSANDLQGLELRGLTLYDSVILISIIKDKDISLADIYNACSDYNHLYDLIINLLMLFGYSDNNISDSNLNKELLNYMLQGYSSEQVKNGYEISEILGLDVSSLLDRADEAVNVETTDESEMKNFEYLAKKYSVNVNTLIGYASENNLTSNNLITLVEDGLNDRVEINNEKNNFSYSRSNMLMTTSSTSVYSATESFIGAPFTYDYNANETVNLNTGSVVYEHVDYTLPGRNNLDLVIGRRYDLDEAKVYDPYYYEQLALIPQLGVGWVVSFEYRKTNNSHYNDIYGLGQGWNMMFSSLELNKQVSDGMSNLGGPYPIYKSYIHLSDGRTIEFNTDTKSLINYRLYDITFHYSGFYWLEYKDGRKEYFSSTTGRLTDIYDRFGNHISFTYDMYNGCPRISINDTMGRTRTIYGQASSNGHIMTVSLPDSVSLSYVVDNGVTNNISFSSLTQYRDPMYTASTGPITTYTYNVSSGRFGGSVNPDTTDGANVYVNLTDITHPTSAVTHYNYTSFDKRTMFYNTNGYFYGYETAFRLNTRYNSYNNELYNSKSYSYSDPNYSSNLTSSSTYNTTVTTTPNSISTKYTFNNLHLLTTNEVTDNSQNPIKVQDISYDYDGYSLLRREAVKKYNYSDQSQYFQIIKSFSYDTQGNVLTSWSPLAEGGTTNTDYETTYTYDSTYSLLTNETYKQNTSTTITKQYTIDSSHKTVTREAISVNGTLKSQTDYAYDAYGNVTDKKLYKDDFTSYIEYQYTYSGGAYLTNESITGVLNADGTSAAASPGYAAGTIVKSYQYNNLGLMTSSTDQDGNTTSYTYDNNRNVTSITNPDNTHVYYTRNYTSKYVIVTDENNNQTKYQYTPLGLLSQISALSGQTETPLQSKSYDALSRVSTVTDYRYGSVTTYTYDCLSRVTHEVVTQGTTVLSDISYSYTDSCDGGTHQKVTKTVVGETNAPSIVTTQYTDKMGFVVKTGKVLNGTEYIDEYTYDYVGNKLTEKLAYAAQLGLAYSSKWEYDYANRVVKTYNADSPTTGAYAATTYDALGNKVSTSDYAGTVTTYTYDSLGRLMTTNVPIDTSGNYSKTKNYYDPAGNVISKKTNNNAIGSAETWAQTDYGYNSRGKLANTIVYTGATSGNVITQYSYDGVGNMTTMRTGASSTTSTDGELTQYAYDRYGNITTLTDPLNQHEYSYYTAQGEPTSKTDRNGNSTTYTYDGLGRLTASSVTVGGAQSTVSTTILPDRCEKAGS